MDQQDECHRPPLSADLLRAARAVLQWSLVEAGERAGISVSAVLSAEERGKILRQSDSVARLRFTYEKAGLSFDDDGKGDLTLRIISL